MRASHVPMACLLLLSLSAPSSARAAGRVVGVVVDATSGKPLAGIQVGLFDSGPGSIAAATTTARDGRFAFEAVPAGKYLLSSSSGGVWEHLLSAGTFDYVAVAADQTASLDLGTMRVIARASAQAEYAPLCAAEKKNGRASRFRLADDLRVLVFHRPRSGGNWVLNREYSAAVFPQWNHRWAGIVCLQDTTRFAEYGGESLPAGLSSVPVGIRGWKVEAIRPNGSVYSGYAYGKAPGTIGVTDLTAGGIGDPMPTLIDQLRSLPH